MGGKDDVFRLTLERFPDGTDRGLGESLPCALHLIPAYGGLEQVKPAARALSDWTGGLRED